MSSTPVSEASRYLTIYTEELGLVRALAQGVRGLRSKLRHSLQDLAYSKVSFVRGREIWRIVNAEKKELGGATIRDGEKKKTLAIIAAVVRRFVHGEGRDEKIFEDVRQIITLLDREAFGKKELRLLEAVFMLRLFHSLGYVKNEPALSEIIDFKTWESAVLEKAEQKEKEMLAVINTAIEHSHL